MRTIKTDGRQQWQSQKIKSDWGGGKLRLKKYGSRPVLCLLLLCLCVFWDQLTEWTSWLEGPVDWRDQLTGGTSLLRLGKRMVLVQSCLCCSLLTGSVLAGVLSTFLYRFFKSPFSFSSYPFFIRVLFPSLFRKWNQLLNFQCGLLHSAVVDSGGKR